MKDIKGFEGLYGITEEGEILNYRTQKFMKQRFDKDGYLRVSLTKDGKQQTFFIHRLLAEAFIPNPKNLPLINHKDENKKNNNLNNLEWCTHWYNLTYSRDKNLALEKGVDFMGFEKTNQKRPGSGTSKPVRCVELNIIYQSGAEAARELNLDASHISKVCRGKANTTGGYHFEFVTEGI